MRQLFVQRKQFEILYARISSRSMVFALLLLNGFFVTAQGPTLQEYDNALQENGCLSIVYPGLRQDCIDNRSAQDHYCKIKWTGGDPTKIQVVVDDIEDNGIPSRQNSIRDLSSKLNSSTDDGEKENLKKDIGKLEDEIKTMESSMNRLKGEIIELKNILREDLEHSERCKSVRQDTQKIFALAKREADNVIGDSNVSPEIKGKAKQLKEKWERGEGNHQKEVDKVEDRIRELKRMLN